MSQDKSGPAFPVQDMSKYQVHGMTLRDYFIAHAPVEPQPWFIPVTPPRPVVGVWVSSDGLRKYTSKEVAYDREQGFFRPFNQDEIEAWLQDFKKQKYTQWPAAWADEMIQQRSKP